MSENLKRHRPDIKVLGEGRAIAFMPEDPMGVWVHIQEVRDLLAEKDKEIKELKEERHWRKCSEGLPLAKQRVLFLAKYKTDKVREWIGTFCHIDSMKVDFAVFYASAPGWGCEFLIDEVIGWMPLPSAPKEADK